MNVTMALIQELRQKTGVGIMDCKEALNVSNTLDDACIYLREKGLAKAVKKSGRDATAGGVFIALNDDQSAGCIVKVNCETDFVSQNETFQSFGAAIVQAALAKNSAHVDDLMVNETPLPIAITDMVAKTGENIQIDSLHHVSGRFVSGYTHMNGTIGVLVGFDQTIETALGKDIAMQIAAANPSYINRDDVPQSILDTERDLLKNQAIENGKPEKIIEQIVNGLINKYYEENCLLDQVFIKDPKIFIRDLLKETTVSAMYRLSL
ncbi:MAG: translation elongation factor Ts [Candidatus Marinamargulisbacteria bacterium]|nr:elongation factor Ts [bacterium]MDG2265277.1 translation elongation factor Ts [Candidatus Marinamargulisbacteria bacterium]|tara:strand:- start:11533 stop:12327 length:795 start_codon:yes stop_codon:yes gene_type:complete